MESEEGTFFISNEQVSVFSATKCQIDKYLKTQVLENSTPPQSAIPTEPLNKDLTNLYPPPPQSLSLKDFDEMISKFSLITNMNLEYSKKCLLACECDFQEAWKRFDLYLQEGSIPAAAFIKSLD